MPHTIKSVSVPKQRPLSPHLDVYKFSWLMANSIINRLAGVTLAGGLLLLSLWLLTLATSEQMFVMYTELLSSVVGKLILFALTLALFQHMAGGIRHLIWDTGAGLDVPTARKMAKFSVLFTILATLIVWFLAYSV